MGDPDRATYGERAAAALDKGKGRAVDNAQPEDVSMGEDEESSSDESIVDDHPAEDDEEEEEGGHDDLDPISTSNIIPSGRTRGKTIDFAEAAAKAQADGYDEMDDDDDDDDFEAHEDDVDSDAMQQ